MFVLQPKKKTTINKHKQKYRLHTHIAINTSIFDTQIMQSKKFHKNIFTKRYIANDYIKNYKTLKWLV